MQKWGILCFFLFFLGSWINLCAFFFFRSGLFTVTLVWFVTQVFLWYMTFKTFNSMYGPRMPSNFSLSLSLNILQSKNYNTMCDVWFKVERVCQSIAVIHFLLVNCYVNIYMYQKLCPTQKTRKKTMFTWPGLSAYQLPAILTIGLPQRHILSISYHAHAATGRSNAQILIVVVLCANKNTAEPKTRVRNPSHHTRSAKVSQRKFRIFSMILDSTNVGKHLVAATI